MDIDSWQKDFEEAKLLEQEVLQLIQVLDKYYTRICTDRHMHTATHMHTQRHTHAQTRTHTHTL